MIMLKSTHDRAMAAHAMTENGLLERIARLELQLKNANQNLTLKSQTILALEEDLVEQSSKITTLSNLNAALTRKYVPVKGKDGRFQPQPQVCAGVGMSAVDNVADVLDAAADLIAPEGAWGQGGYQPRKGCFCILGALAKASGHSPENIWLYPVSNSARSAIADAIGTDISGIVNWNDAPERTQAEVVVKLREAAALARQEQAA